MGRGTSRRITPALIGAAVLVACAWGTRRLEGPGTDGFQPRHGGPSPTFRPTSIVPGPVATTVAPEPERLAGGGRRTGPPQVGRLRAAGRGARRGRRPPDAFGGAWNDGRPGADPVVPGGAVGDVRFLRLVIDEIGARTAVDPRRVAVVGFSNGAVMAGRVACELADRVAAVAVVGGTAGQGFEQSCRPVRPVAMMAVAGSNDRTVPYGGGRVADWGTRRRGFVAAVVDFFAFRRTQAGCSSTQPVPALPQVAAARGIECRAETAVVSYRVNGGRARMVPASGPGHYERRLGLPHQALRSRGLT